LDVIFPEKSDQEWQTMLQSILPEGRIAQWRIRVDDAVIPELAALAAKSNAAPQE
jgi:hypothetical protein